MQSKFIALLGGAALSLGLVSASSAADMAVKARPMVAPIMFSWTGCYIGLQGGFKSGRNQVNYGANTIAQVIGSPAGPDYDFTGGLIGGTVGCNYQVGNWVFGIEGDGSWATGDGDTVETAFPAFRIRSEERWLATYRGRVGYTFTPNWLVYITGGGASTGLRLSNFIPNTATSVSQENTLNGWTIGGGMEYAINNHWSVKAEGLYIEYSRSSYFTPTTPVALAVFDLRLTEVVGRVGVNYRF
ncbi:MAG: outer membrane beta-barrel protein [Bradyrhizobium sp.]